MNLRQYFTLSALLPPKRTREACETDIARILAHFDEPEAVARRIYEAMCRDGLIRDTSARERLEDE